MVVNNTFGVRCSSWLHIYMRGGLIYIHLWVMAAPCGDWGLLWLFVAQFGSTSLICSYLSPSTLTMPLNYNAVS